jgi:hypothetical protein
MNTDNDNHEMSQIEDMLMGITAKEIAPGVTLMTKDGRTIGNAIVIREIEPITTMADYLKKTGQKLWLIETDFGNQVQYTDREIGEFFNLGFQQNYTRWLEARSEALWKVQNPEPEA